MGLDWRKMTIKTSIVNILVKEEGFRPYIYDDATGKRLQPGSIVAGTPTIGYGTVDITKEDAQMLLEARIKRIIDVDLLHFTKYLSHMSEMQIVVLSCMIYQLGLAGVKGFKKMLEAIELEDFEEAARQMLDSRWHEQTPKRCERMAELMRVHPKMEKR